MLLELSKAVSFFASLLSLYPVAISAFFLPATRWQDRIELILPRLALSALICLASALLFAWPVRSNPTRGQALTSTLPLRLFFWATAGIAILFVLSWYLVCGAPACGIIGHDCGCSTQPF